MSIQKKLETLIKEDVLVEIEDYIDELFEVIAAKKDTAETKGELEGMKEMKEDFEAILEDIEKGELDDEEALEIYDEIIDMIEGEEE